MASSSTGSPRTPAPPEPSGPGPSWWGRLTRTVSVFQHTPRAVGLVWATDPRLLVGLGAMTLAAALLPASVAWVGKQIVDAVVEASAAVQAGTAVAWAAASVPLLWVAAEFVLVGLRSLVQRGLSVSEQLLRARLGHRVNRMILEGAVSMSLPQFEDSTFYDKLTRARRQASRRPLSLVRRTFGLGQDALTLLTYAGLLLTFSPWAVVILAVAALPQFVAETRFSEAAFRLFSWRAEETRQQAYLEAVLAREGYAKEVKLMGLGPELLRRYEQIFRDLFAEDRDLTLRRGAWGAALGLLATAAFYGTYAWVALSTVQGVLTLGEMTMVLMVFKQGQSTIASALSSIGGMYEDNLYLSTLYDFLEGAVPERTGGATEGPDPSDGIRFEGVSFTYPGADTPALQDVSLHLPPGSKVALVGENGSGKTTLIKLLAGLYTPDQGRVMLDGLDVDRWDLPTLRRRIGVIFQDFVRYQLLLGENIGVGDVEALDDEARWARAAEHGLVTPFLERLPQGMHTQLGRWFKDGQELSGGQWQKVALSRAFMREDADILVLDEPTAAMDAEAEYRVFERFRELTEGRTAVLVSHRFSTVRMADRIVVMHRGRVEEVGSHDALVQAGGRYAHLFSLQAEGYR